MNKAWVFQNYSISTKYEKSTSNFGTKLTKKWIKGKSLLIVQLSFLKTHFFQDNSKTRNPSFQLLVPELSLSISKIVNVSLYPFWGCDSFVFEAPNSFGFASIFFYEGNDKFDVLPFYTALFPLVFLKLHFFIFMFYFKFCFTGNIFRLAFVFTNISNGCPL